MFREILKPIALVATLSAVGCGAPSQNSPPKTPPKEQCIALSDVHIKFGHYILASKLFPVANQQWIIDSYEIFPVRSTSPESLAKLAINRTVSFDGSVSAQPTALFDLDTKGTIVKKLPGSSTAMDLTYSADAKEVVLTGKICPKIVGVNIIPEDIPSYTPIQDNV